MCELALQRFDFPLEVFRFLEVDDGAVGGVLVLFADVFELGGGEVEFLLLRGEVLLQLADRSVLLGGGSDGWVGVCEELLAEVVNVFVEAAALALEGETVGACFLELFLQFGVFGDEVELVVVEVAPSVAEIFVGSLTSLGPGFEAGDGLFLTGFLLDQTLLADLYFFQHLFEVFDGMRLAVCVNMFLLLSRLLVTHLFHGLSCVRSLSHLLFLCLRLQAITIFKVLELIIL